MNVLKKIGAVIGLGDKVQPQASDGQAGDVAWDTDTDTDNRKVDDMNTEAKLVGPVIRGVDDDIINAVINAAEQDNPDKDIIIDDRAGYVRVQAGGSMVLTEASMNEMLGRPFRLSELEPSLVSFAGRLNTMDDKWEWSLHA